MKKLIVCCLSAVVVAGCSAGKSQVGLMIENPPAVLKDSLYTGYKEKSEELESRYLNKEISYAEYMSGMEELEGGYTQEADRRQNIVEGN